MRMVRKLGSLACVIAVVATAGVAAAPAAGKTLGLPPVHQIAQQSLPKPNGVAYDPWSDDVYVTSVGPPPRVYIYRERPSPHEVGFINLPEGSDPGAAIFGDDGYLYVIDHSQKAVLVIDPESGEVNQSLVTPAGVQFATGMLFLYNVTAQATRAILDFGDSFSAGSIWYGAGFQMRLPMPDTITPNGGDVLPDTAKPRNGQISAEQLVADAQNNAVARVGGSQTLSFLGEIGGLPGTPGLQPPRDLDVNPLNLNSDVSGAALHPIFIPFPDLGLYESAGPNGPWIQIPAANIGRPTQVDSDCQTIGATSFSQNLVTFFDTTPPKNSHCEDLVELLILGGAPLRDTPQAVGAKFAVGIKAYVDATGKIPFGGGATKQSAVAAKSKAKKFRLTAGKVTKVKLPIPAAVLSGRKKTFKVKMKLRSPLGERTTVVRQIRVRGK